MIRNVAELLKPFIDEERKKLDAYELAHGHSEAADRIRGDGRAEEASPQVELHHLRDQVAGFFPRPSCTD